MAAVALIQFTQGAHTDVAGKAVLGAYADFSAVTVSNGDNTGVVSWKIFLLDAPPDSTTFPASAQPQILAQATSATPTVAFTPDVAGTYRIMLEVLDGLGNPDRDIRCFAVPDARGFVRPPYQQSPAPLPVALPGILTESPRPIKPDEQNYGTNVRGWAGNGTAKQVDSFLRQYADLPHQVVTTTPFSATESGPPLYLINVATIGGPAVFNLPLSPRVNLVVRVGVLGAPDDPVVIHAQGGGGTIEPSGTLPLLGGSAVSLVHRGSNQWSIVSGTAPGANHEALTTWFSGTELRTRWMHKTGATTVYLKDYLERTTGGNNIQQALNLALAENPQAEVFDFPSGTFEITQHDDGWIGLRSNMWLRGNNTRLRLDMTPWTSGMYVFRFADASSNFRMSGIWFQSYNQQPVTFGASVIICYGGSDILIDSCKLECVAVPTFGTKLAISLISSTRAKVEHCTFIRAQCGFGGYGASCKDVTFSDNIGVEVTDFLCSAVVDGTGPCQRVAMVDNVVEGVNGTGVFFVGTDGQGPPGGVSPLVEDIIIANNIIGGDWSGPVAAAYGIILDSGIITRRVRIDGNVIGRSDSHPRGGNGILVQSGAGATLFQDLSISGNIIGPLGEPAAVGYPVVCSAPVDGLKVDGNSFRGSRGVDFYDARDAHFTNNTIITAAGGTPFRLRAITRSISRCWVSGNIFVGPGPGFPIGFVLDGPNDIDAEFDQNHIEPSPLPIPAGGTFRLRFRDNVLPNGLGTVGAHVIYARDNVGFPVAPGNRHTILTGATGSAALRMSVEEDGQFVTYNARGLRGVISPTAIAANQNNYAPTGLATAATLRLTTNGGGPFNVTGIDIAQFPASFRDGVALRVYNISTNLADILRFTNEDGASNAGNRIITPLGETFDLVHGSMCELWYDAVASRWRLGLPFKTRVIFQAVTAPATATNPGFGETIVLVDTANGGWAANNVITLPSAPLTQGRVTVKDSTGSAGTKPIVVNGNGFNVDGVATRPLALPYGALTCVFTGTAWAVI